MLNAQPTLRLFPIFIAVSCVLGGCHSQLPEPARIIRGTELARLGPLLAASPEDSFPLQIDFQPGDRLKLRPNLAGPLFRLEGSSELDLVATRPFSLLMLRGRPPHLRVPGGEWVDLTTRHGSLTIGMAVMKDHRPELSLGLELGE